MAPPPKIKPDENLDALAQKAGVSQAEVANVLTPSPELTPVAAVASALDIRSATEAGQQIATPGASQARTDETGKVVGFGPTPPLDGVVGSSEDVVSFEDRTTDTVSGLGTISDAEERVKTASQDFLTQLETLEKDLETQRTGRVSAVEEQFGAAARELETAQERETGTISTALTSVGGYLGTQISGVGVLLTLGRSHRNETQALEAKRAAAIQAANNAIDDKQFEVALAQADEAKQVAKDIESARTVFFDNMVKLSQEQRDMAEFNRESAGSTLDAIAASDNTPSDEYFDMLAETYNLSRDEVKGMFQISRQERRIKTTQDAIQTSRDISNLLNTVAIGTPIEVNGFTYYGTKGAGDIEIDNTTGEASMFSVNQLTGAISQRKVGQFAAPKDGGRFEMVGGEPFMFFKDGTYQSYTKPATDLDAVVPPGQYQSEAFTDDAGNPLPLQCGELVNHLTGSTVGSTLEEKVSRIDTNITPETLKEGNTIVFGGSSTGHVAVVTRIFTGPDGKLKLKLSEANFDSQGTVDHTREVFADDPSIKGFIGSSFTDQFNIGTDNSLSRAIEREIAGEADEPVLGLFEDPTIDDVASSLAIGQKSSQDSEAFQEKFRRAVESGDAERVKQATRFGVRNSLFAEPLRDYDSRQTVRAGLIRAEELIREFEETHPAMNFFRGSAEEIFNKFGETTDPELKRIGNFIKPFLFTYRKAQTGVAFSERESADYESIFPGTKATAQLNTAKIEGLIEAMNINDEQQIRTVIGDAGFGSIFGESLREERGLPATAEDVSDEEDAPVTLPVGILSREDLQRARAEGREITTNSDGTVTIGVATTE